MPRSVTNAEWLTEITAKGHTPILYSDGSLHMFATESGFHHGPACSVCGWSCCIYCDGLDSITACGGEPPAPTPLRVLRYVDGTYTIGSTDTPVVVEDADG